MAEAKAKALEYVGIARMGGGIETGETNAKALVKSGKAKLLLVASDTSDGAHRRAEGYVFGTNVPLVTVPYSKAEIAAMAGRPGCSMAAFTDLGLAAAFAEALYREYGAAYRPLAEALVEKRTRALQNGKKGKRRKNACAALKNIESMRWRRISRYPPNP